MAALIPIGIGGLWNLIKYNGFNHVTAWWVWFAVAGGIVAVCFAHVALGLVIGFRLADLIFKIVLAIGVVGGVYWLTKSLDPRHGW